VPEVLATLTVLEPDGAVHRHEDGYTRSLRGPKQRA